jgi:hypothetical protein
LNRASVERTISKQERMCLVGQLPLVLCSETLKPVYQLLSVVRIQSWRQNKSFKLPKTTTTAYTQKQKNTLLSPIQSSLTSLLHPVNSMRGYQIEDYLELVIEGKDNMSYIQTHIPPELYHHGILYWDSLLEADNPNSKVPSNYSTSTAVLCLLEALTRRQPTRFFMVRALRNLRSTCFA